MKIKKIRWIFIFSSGILSVLAFNWLLDYTSSNSFCASCHVHPQATQNWRMGSHFDNKSGVIVNCVDCHLPPDGIDYISAKAVTGIRDVYGVMFKDEEDFNWDLKSTREAATEHVYKAGCIKCHQNLFPRTLSKKGEDAHLYYDQRPEELRCINCHLEVGHFHEQSSSDTEVLTAVVEKDIYLHSAEPQSFVDFTETVPGTVVDFNMIAIHGGKFKIGSPVSESFRNPDEGPQVQIELDPFWMGEIEVSWDEYLAFYNETSGQGRSEDQIKAQEYARQKGVDAITGPTPAYGNPDQGWGRGKRPAITMTHYAARKYCEWISKKTGKTYRLPTEAEWEYACRAGQKGPYFFEGEPDQYSSETFLNKLFGSDTTVINSFVIYAENSLWKTNLPEKIKPNPFGLRNSLGNVKEFCSDYYTEDIYSDYLKTEITRNPTGPADGKEFVIRGGSFKSDASRTRVAAREKTDRDKWLVTDPQIPKSLWWYSDCNDVGFRVVCEVPEQIKL